MRTNTLRSDSELVRASRNGNRAAFTELVRRYENAAFGTALTYVASRDDAEDVVQDSFVTAYLKLVHLKDPDRFGAWLRGIVVTRSREFLRRTLRRQAVVSPSEPTDAQIAHESDRRQGDTRRSADLWTAVNHLPEKFRQVVLTYYVNDYTYEQVATYLRLPTSTVKGRLQQSRMALKQQLSPEESEETTMARSRMEKQVENSIAKIAREEIHETIPLNGTRNVVLFSSMDADIEICQTDGDAVIVTGSKATVGLSDEEAQKALDTVQVRGDQVENYRRAGPQEHKIARFGAGLYDSPRKVVVRPVDYQWQIPALIATGTSLRQSPPGASPYFAYYARDYFPELATREADMVSILWRALEVEATRVSIIHEDVRAAQLPLTALTESVRRVFAPTIGPRLRTFSDDGTSIVSEEGGFVGIVGRVDLVVAVPRGTTVTILHSRKGRIGPKNLGADPRGLIVVARDLEANLNMIGCHDVEIDGVTGDVCLLDTRLVAARNIRGRFLLSDYHFGEWPFNGDERYPPRPVLVEDVVGEMQVDAARLDLTIRGIQGSATVRNRFGPTLFHMTSYIPGSEVCVETDSGELTLRIEDALFTPEIIGVATVAAFTLCGKLIFALPWSGTSYTPEAYGWRHHGKGDPKGSGWDPPTIVAKSMSGTLLVGLASWLDRKDW